MCRAGERKPGSAVRLGVTGQRKQACTDGGIEVVEVMVTVHISLSSDPKDSPLQSRWGTGPNILK